MKITFIGLGIMGSRMAAHLLKSGADLTVYNRSQSPMEALAKSGANVSQSIKEAVSSADIVFTMLSKPEVVESLMLEEGLSAMKEGALWVDCSTVNPSFTLQAKTAAEQQKVLFLEAPVAGTKPQAEAAELVFFVGGESRELEKVRPFLEVMGSKVLHLGAVSLGASFKMVVNMMLGMSMAAFSESVKLGETLGLDKDFLLDTVPNLPVAAPFLKMKANMIKEGSKEVQFPLELLHKDLHLAMVSAYEGATPLPFTNAAKEIYAEKIAQGLGREDMAAL